MRFWIVVVLGLAGCQGDSPSASSPPPPAPPEALGETFAVSLHVFEDRNGDGRPGGGERSLAGVEVSVYERRARTDGAGRVTVPGVPRGTHRVSLGLQTLPPFLATAQDVYAVAPGAGDVPVAVSFPIGNNTPDSYLAYGDSITSGDGSSDGLGFRGRLQRKLESFYGRRLAFSYRGGGGGRTDFAMDGIEVALRQTRPAFVLIQWGVNDWNNRCAVASCSTMANLRQMIRACRAVQSLPCLATITPANTGYDQRAPRDRSDWVAEINTLIRPIAAEEGALLVDLYAAFPPEGARSGLFVDHVHPNDTGHELIAETYFRALTERRPVSHPPLVRELSL